MNASTSLSQGSKRARAGAPSVPVNLMGRHMSKYGPGSTPASINPSSTVTCTEYNRRFLEEVRARFPYDEGRVIRLSLIEEFPLRQVRSPFCLAGRNSP